MIEHCSILKEKLQFFGKMPPQFQQSFCCVFGTEVRDEKDVINLTIDYCDLMWDKVNNGRFVRVKDIVLTRGDESIFFEPRYDKHHWPPRSVGGKETIKLVEKFHKHWHIVFMNLHQEKEFRIYLKMLFYDDEIKDFSSLYEAADKARKEAKRRR